MTNFDEYMPDDEYTVEDALAALPIDPNKIIPPAVVYGFANMDPIDLEQVRAVWRSLPDPQREIIMERLAEVGEVDFMTDYAVFARVGFDDPSPVVRECAIKAAWTDEDLNQLKTLMQIAQQDPVVAVRAAAIDQIGNLIAAAEMDGGDERTESAEAMMLTMLKQPNLAPILYCALLEALAYSTQNSEISGRIMDAFNSGDKLLVISALTAMGNTIDPAWEEQVIRGYDSQDNDIRLAAILAAGSIGLPYLVYRTFLIAIEESGELPKAALWALTEIANAEAIECLQNLLTFANEEDWDEEMIEMIEESLAMALLTGGDGFEDGDEFEDE